MKIPFNPLQLVTTALKYCTNSTWTILRTLETISWGGWWLGSSIGHGRSATFRGGSCVNSEADGGVNSPQTGRDASPELRSPSTWEASLWVLSYRPGAGGLTTPQGGFRSKLVKGMTLGGNKDVMHVNEYLHKCLHHKIHPGKQHCRVHTQRETSILVHFPMRTRQPLHGPG